MGLHGTVSGRRARADSDADVENTLANSANTLRTHGRHTATFSSLSYRARKRGETEKEKEKEAREGECAFSASRRVESLRLDSAKRGPRLHSAHRVRKNSTTIGFASSVSFVLGNPLNATIECALVGNRQEIVPQYFLH